VKRTSVPEMLSPPKPRKPPFTIEGAMNNIFKKKKLNSKTEIEDVVIEKVIVLKEEPVKQVNPVKPVELHEELPETKPNSTGLKKRFFFTRSKASKKEDATQLNENNDLKLKQSSKVEVSKVEQSESSLCSSDCLTVKRHPSQIQSQNQNQDQNLSNGQKTKPAQTKRWSRHSKGSPPPPPTPQQPKSNGVTTKAPAPLPPLASGSTSTKKRSTSPGRKI